MLNDPFTPEMAKRHCQPMRSRRGTKDGEYHDYVRMSSEFFVQLRAQWGADKKTLVRALHDCYVLSHYLRDKYGANQELIDQILADKFKPTYPGEIPS